ncbi:ATPase, H+ transporting, V1 subunit G isoform 2, isoform CRA_a [Rattus norvegicus]|uniref:ATPase, H+ transporting, V1 subunit G isoform 2, isoform CRA_a n=1 Tax=Rattus norvegicus TaxID=10116 RepID=A6KTX2_RAT|nr:ATPase, H+ transporting, V1 subunit G isoform 2, isoform CRA_a [Rattus norvegicus]
MPAPPASVRFLLQNFGEKEGNWWPGKARRLKQAKEEAQMEVEQYRREREQEFQSKQQAVSCGESRDGLTPVQIVGASCKMYVGDSTRS